MAVELVLRNGTAAENDAFTGALAEVTVDKTNNTLRVHDGSTPGGTPLLTGGSSGATLTDITLAGTTSSESGSNLVFEPDTQIVEIRGDGTSVVGQLQLNCQVNTHGQIIAAQPHSENSTNVLTLPGGDTIGDADATLVSDTGTQDLSNKTLSSPTFSGQVTGDLVPSSDVTFDLGSATNRWKDLFLSGTTLDIGGATISVVGGSFEFKDSSGNDTSVSLAANTTDDLAQGITNLYAAQPVDTTDDVTFNSVTVDGDLIVNGTSTTLNTTTLDVEDINITVANGASSATAANGAGLTIDLGTDGTADFTYDSSNDRLTSNKTIATDLIGNVTGTVSDISNHDTDDLSEGTNLYYTDSRVDAHLSGGTGVGFNAGVISIGQSVGTTDDVSFNTVTSDVTGNLTGTVSDISNHDTDDLSEGVSNLYYTDARVDSHLNGGTGVSFSNGTISIGQSVDTTDNVTFNNINVSGTLSSDDISASTVTASNDLVVQGNLTVQGTTTSTNTNEITTESPTVTLVDGLDENTAPSQDAGIVVNRGSSVDKTFLWKEGVDKWSLGTESLIAGTVEADLIGNVTGNVTGDVTGNVTGDVTGNVTGDVTGTVSDISNHDTDDLSEGSTNLYYTDARVDAHLSGGSGIDFSTGTISHSDTSSVGNVTASSNTFVDALTFDDFGHVTAVSTSTAAPPNDATITVSAGTGLSGGGNFTTDQSNDETISLDVDTSTIATRSYVDTEVANLVDSSPATLDTLNELAAALGDDPNFATTVSNDIGTKAAKTTTISAGSGLTGGGDLSANRTISHADTSSQGSVNGSGNTFIQDVTLDGFGHVTGLATNTLTTTDLGLDTNDGVRHGSLGIGTSAPSSGQIRATNNITAFFSDERLKDFIGPIGSALDKINHIGGYYFTENQTAKDLGYDNQERQVGVNAQEVQKVLPEVVKIAPISYNDDVETDYLTVQYEKLVPLLIEAIKEQQEQIDELKKKLYK